MKKSLVLAMAMALGVTASAYAANPFSDVPVGHWAYDSVNKLAAAGVVDGFPDGTYGGDKLMTRYEMAQIVAKAMAKGANVDKLAAEFAEELDTLGVRVANLEEKADNVKITGEVRYRYQESDLNGYTNDFRTRLWVTGQINDDWSYTGMVENTQDFGNDNGDESDVAFQRAYVEGKLGGLDVTAGRYNAVFGNGYIYDTRADGVEVAYGEKLQVKAFAGKATASGGVTVLPEVPGYVTEGDAISVDNGGDYAGAELSYDMGKLNLNAGYINFKDMGGDKYADLGVENAIWHVGAAYSWDNVTLEGTYLKGDMSANGVSNTELSDVLEDDGYVVGVSYKGAAADEVGSWGMWAKYFDQGAQTYVAHTTDANTFGMTGFEGYGVAANYTFAKNVVGTVAWYDTESKLADKLGEKIDDQILWADLTFTF